MIVDRYPPKQLFRLVPDLPQAFEPELAQLDRLLEDDAIFGRIKARGIAYGSGPDSPTDGTINTRRGGRGFYFEDPYGHLLEVMTVPETGT